MARPIELSDVITPLIRLEVLGEALKSLSEGIESECAKFKAAGHEPSFSDLEKVKKNLCDVIENLLSEAPVATFSDPINRWVKPD